jgi:hypothetical protein
MEEASTRFLYKMNPVRGWLCPCKKYIYIYLTSFLLKRKGRFKRRRNIKEKKRGT